MTDLTQTQWMWIIGIVVVLALGGLGYYFSTRGQLGMQGVQFQTGFGVGAPAMYKGMTYTCDCGAGCKGNMKGGMCDCAACPSQMPSYGAASMGY